MKFAGHSGHALFIEPFPRGPAHYLDWHFEGTAAAKNTMEASVGVQALRDRRLVHGAVNKAKGLCGSESKTKPTRDGERTDIRTLQDSEHTDRKSWPRCFCCGTRVHPGCERRLLPRYECPHVSCASLECFQNLHPRWLDVERSLVEAEKSLPFT